MMKLTPYLAYPGTCEEALNYYKSVMGGEIGEKNLHDRSPMESPESKGKIPHADYKFGDENRTR
jgi:PhnB protein